jgi:hypothetical protein
VPCKEIGDGCAACQAPTLTAFLDANILVRRLTGDAAKLAKRAAAVLAGGERVPIAAIEERLHTSDQGPDELRARARELREQAERSDVKAIRDAAPALDERYEHAASARLGAR